MTTKLQKWGNSLAVRIPKEVSGGLRSGTSIQFRRTGDVLSLHPLKKKKYTLTELARNINTKNRHKESDWGTSHGKELW